MLISCICEVLNKAQVGFERLPTTRTSICVGVHYHSSPKAKKRAGVAVGRHGDAEIASSCCCSAFCLHSSVVFN
jgi:hypothetical protein